jgi:hypothetical protein
MTALTVIGADPVGASLLESHNLHRVPRGRSGRIAANGRAEGLAILEGVVLSGVIRILLTDVELVLWLSRHYPRELAIFHVAIGSLPTKNALTEQGS